MPGKRGSRKPIRRSKTGWTPLAQQRFKVFTRPPLPDISRRAYRAIERMGPDTIVFKIERDHETWDDRNMEYNVARRQNDEIIHTAHDRGMIRNAILNNIRIESRHMIEVIMHTLYAFHAYRMTIALSVTPVLRMSAYKAMCQRISKRLRRLEEAVEKKERLLHDRVALEQEISNVIHLRSGKK